MKSHDMLEVIGKDGSAKRYINGRRTTNSRWDLCQCYARMGGSLDCFITRIAKDGRVFHRHVARCKIDFSR